MKCKFVLDVDMDTSTLPDSEKAKLQFRKGAVKNAGGTATPRPIPYFPKGTEYEHPGAYLLVRHGLAIPADDECTKACGLTDEEQAKAQALYKRLDLGITDDDKPLYDAGVIEGYDPSSPDGYIHGKNWDAYQAAIQSVEAEQSQALVGEAPAAPASPPPKNPPPAAASPTTPPAPPVPAPAAKAPADKATGVAS